MKKNHLLKILAVFCIFMTASFAVVFTASAAPISATIGVNPGTVNLAYNDKWITVYIGLPKPYDVRQIDIASVTLNVNDNTIPASPQYGVVGGYKPALMAKFDGTAVRAHLFTGSDELTISGMVGGYAFRGSATINVTLATKYTVPLTILQTSDVHDHASGFGPYLDYTPLWTFDNDVVHGGFSRLATVIGKARAMKAAVGISTLLLDSGDWYMGTTYDMTASPDPAALRFLQTMKYDAITLGNHEFDWSDAGLAMILSNGITNGFSVPVVATNTVFNDNPSATGDDSLKALKTAGYIVEKRVMVLPSGLKIGLLGLMGPDADQDAPVAKPVTFNHSYAFIQSRVDDLRNNDNVDMVVVLSHSGIRSDGTGDDDDIAENVTGIDIICSGHYHTAIFSPFIKGASNSIIFEPGQYGEYVSQIDIKYSPMLGRVAGFDYRLLPVDDKVAGNSAIQGMVNTYNTALNAALAPLGVRLDSPISSTSFDLTQDSPIPLTGVTGLGGLCADSVRNVCNALAPYNFGTPIHVGVVANGVIRDPLLKGKKNTHTISFSDVYNCLPLGISPYQPSPPGYPIMNAYLLGSEVKTLCALSLSVSQAIGNNFYLNLSGLQIDYKPSEWPNGIKAVRVYSPADPLCVGPAVDIVNGNLYHIAVDLYALQMLGIVNAYLPAFGLPPIFPRDAGGNILNLNNPTLVASLRIKANASGTELKEWMALLNYLPTLGATIPASVYDHDHGGAVTARVNIVP